MKKILIVEDDTLLSEMLSDEFVDSGYKVFQAFDGEEGFEKVRSEKPDLVLLDINMPKKDGIELLRDLKADMDTKNIPIIMLTVSANEEKLEETIRLGAIDALLKSRFTVEGVVSRVEEHLLH